MRRAGVCVYEFVNISLCPFLNLPVPMLLELAVAICIYKRKVQETLPKSSVHSFSDDPV